MAEFPAPNTGAAAGQPPVSGGACSPTRCSASRRSSRSCRRGPLVAPLLGLLGIAGLIVAYVKRDDARGTWVASHFRWLIRTFWFSFLWGVVGGIVLSCSASS